MADEWILTVRCDLCRRQHPRDRLAPKIASMSIGVPREVIKKDMHVPLSPLEEKDADHWVIQPYKRRTALAVAKSGRHRHRLDPFQVRALQEGGPAARSLLREKINVAEDEALTSGGPWRLVCSRGHARDIGRAALEALAEPAKRTGQRSIHA